MNYPHDSFGRHNPEGQPEEATYYPSYYPPTEPPRPEPSTDYSSPYYDPPSYPYPSRPEDLYPYGQPQPGYPQEEQPGYYPLAYPQWTPDVRPDSLPSYPQQPYYEAPHMDSPRTAYDRPQPMQLQQPLPSEGQPKKVEQAAPTVSKGLINAYGWLEALVSAWIIMVVFCTFFLRTVGVDGPSMKPTLEDKDKLVVTSMFYQPKRGDIVVIKPTEKMPDKALIKRVIGLPGDQIEISVHTGGNVYVNGVELKPEDYIMEPIQLSAEEEYFLTVPEGCVFVLGDNRNNSVDSRSPQVDMVDIRYLMGKVIFRVGPHMHFFEQPSYNGG